MENQPQEPPSPGELFKKFLADAVWAGLFILVCAVCEYLKKTFLPKADGFFWWLLEFVGMTGCVASAMFVLQRFFVFVVDLAKAAVSNTAQGNSDKNKAK
jgi:hypothetical protein